MLPRKPSQCSDLFEIVNRISGSVLVLDEEVRDVVVVEEADSDGGVALAVGERRFPDLLESFAAGTKKIFFSLTIF